MKTVQRAVMLAVLALGAIFLSGCQGLDISIETTRASIGYNTAIHNDLISLPPPREKVVVAVYRFRDQTGQFKTFATATSFSTVVTQGATSMLNKALEDSGWFLPIEREALPNLLNERKIIRSTRLQYQSEGGVKLPPLPALLYAGVLLEGGIIAYDTNFITGGLGVRYFGLGGSGRLQKDRITIYLRLVSTQNGKILKSVSTTKSILSKEVDLGIYRFVRIKRLLEAETGLSTNEPPSMCVLEAIEKAVYDLIIEGIIDGIWSLKNPEDINCPAIQNYLKEKEQTEKVVTFDEEGNLVKVEDVEEPEDVGEPEIEVIREAEPKEVIEEPEPEVIEEAEPEGVKKPDTAVVNIKVNMVNVAPAITTIPVTTVIVGTPYTYDVNATDPDVGDALLYSLTTKPEGMNINPANGLIEWTPAEAQIGTYHVVVKVEDNNTIPASDTQSFTIKVNWIPPKVSTLTIVGGHDSKSGKVLSDGKTKAVQTSDDNRLEIEPGSYVLFDFDFSDVFIPAGAVITSAVIYVEHFEQEQYRSKQLQWDVGTGRPSKPTVWVSIKAPVHKGEQNEATDLWDVTSFVGTPEKLSSLQLRIKNNDIGARKKTFVDYIYAVAKWHQK